MDVMIARHLLKVLGESVWLRTESGTRAGNRLVSSPIISV